MTERMSNRECPATKGVELSVVKSANVQTCVDEPLAILREMWKLYRVI